MTTNNWTCAECGATLDARPTLCPLCGSETETVKSWGPAETPAVSLDRETYQSRLRDLREQLRKLREGDAEAV